VDCVTSETMVIELLKSKCMPILLYGLEGCPLNKSHIISDLKYLKKYLKYFNILRRYVAQTQEIIWECHDMFNCLCAEHIIAIKEKRNFCCSLLILVMSFVAFSVTWPTRIWRPWRIDIHCLMCQVLLLALLVLSLTVFHMHC